MKQKLVDLGIKKDQKKDGSENLILKKEGKDLCLGKIMNPGEIMV